MLSICIPVYNFDVTTLVSSLSEQIKRISKIIEIVLIDDCSDKVFIELNKECCEKHTYIKLKKNIGRSKIRNLFLSYVSHEFLLFLDCDSLIINKNFIQNYLNVLENSEAKVLCGGRIYENFPPSKGQLLSWKYGVKRESQSVEKRLKNPYGSFMTNNFLVHREVLKLIPFDERLSNYGHEDTLFGFYLRKRRISIQHIENPILNGDIENNDEYLNKTELAIKNLITVLSYIDDKESFVEEVSLLSFYRKVNKLKYVFSIVSIFSNLIFWLLLRIGYANLKLFDIYKLSYLIKSENKKAAKQ